jgi:drug/metabolite transporter (DMT)-like permease
MVWVLLAVLAHAGNALVFVVDKSLLGSNQPISQPVRYAFYSGLLAGAAGLLLLVPSFFAPVTMFVVGVSTVAGLFHLLALLFFFTALKGGEPSRVVPIAGSVVPLFTFLFAATALGEVLAVRHIGAVALLIVGGGLLSLRLKSARGISGRVLFAAVFSGVFFAAYFAAIKFLYDLADPFLAVFAYSRLIEAALALVLFGPVVLLSSPQRKRRVSPSLAYSGAVPAVFVANKILAAAAFLLQSYAISLGSVTIVNALQGTQYVALLLLAATVSVWWPWLYREEFSRVALWQKVSGIALVSGGITLLA